MRHRNALNGTVAYPIALSKNTLPIAIVPERLTVTENVRRHTVKKKRGRLLFTILAAFVIVISAFSVYSLRILFDEALYTNEGTFAYYLAVPSLIADAPRPEQIGEPRFYVTAGDGPKAPASAVHFRSNAESGDFFRALEAYMNSESLSRAGTLAEVFPTDWALHRTHGEEAIVYRPEAGTTPQHVIIRVEGIDGTVGDVTITATY